MSREALATHREGTSPPAIDREALLVALVLAPATYSRNRFFNLYKDADVRRVRRRASALRSLLRQIARGVTAVRVGEDDRGVSLAYVVPALGLKRTARLDRLELAVLRFALASAHASVEGVFVLPQSDRALVEATLSRLAPT